MSEYGSDAVVDFLRELGVRHVPLTPGASFRGLHDSLVNHGGADGPDVLLCGTEGMAVAAAHAYAKATRTVQFAVVHNVVGLMQATMALFNAWCDRAPVVVLGGSGPADPELRRPVDWFHSAGDQSALVREFVKWDDNPVTLQACLDGMARAYRIAGTAPTGPVYVTLDSALQEQETPAVAQPTAERVEPDPPSGARSSDISRIASLLLKAEQPGIVTGRTGLDPQATPLAIQLAESVGAFVHDERDFVTMPTSHPLNLSGDPDVLREADVLLCVEIHDLNRLMAQAGAEDRAVTIVDLSPNLFAMRSWSNAGHGRPRDVRSIPADGLSAMSELVGAVDEQLGSESAGAEARDQRRRELAERHARLRETQRSRLEAGWDADPISADRLVWEVWEAVRAEPWLLVLRNTRSWPQGLWEFSGAGEFLGGSGGGGVGYGPGALLGGALAARERGQLPVGIIGDGDFLYGTSMLWTACHYELPMLVVVHNNRTYQNDEDHQAAVARQRGRPVGNAHVGVRMESPTVDYAALARSYGAFGIGPVLGAGDLAKGLAEGVERVKRGQVAVVDVRTG